MPLLQQLPSISSKKGWPWTEDTPSNVYDDDTNWPKISIVTPSYNQGHFIEETIRSILLQNYPNLEYIIIDGGSTDNTVEIIKKYEPWIDYWVSEKDEGQTDALNKGISKCTGIIFNWINSDDILLPNALFHIAKAFFDNPQAKVVAGIQEIKEYPSNKSVWKYGIVQHNSIEEYIVDPFYAQQATFFAKAYLPFPLNPVFNYCMDLNMWCIFLLGNGIENIHFIKNKLAVFRVHEASKTGSELGEFVIDSYKIEYVIIKLLQVDRHIQSYLELRLTSHQFDINQLKTAEGDYSTDNIDAKRFAFLWAKRESMRASRLSLNVKEKFALSRVYWKYAIYESFLTKFKCWIADILFPQLYHKNALSKT